MVLYDGHTLNFSLSYFTTISINTWDNNGWKDDLPLELGLSNIMSNQMNTGLVKISSGPAMNHPHPDSQIASGAWQWSTPACICSWCPSNPVLNTINKPAKPALGSLKCMKELIQMVHHVLLLQEMELLRMEGDGDHWVISCGMKLKPSFQLVVVHFTTEKKSCHLW